MIAAVLMVALHGAVFVEQEYAGPFPVSSREYGCHEPGFRIVDVDGDGATDILQTNEVVFQRDGAFRNENRKALPDLGEPAVCQVWNRDIYFRTPTRLEVIRWEEPGWKRILSQEIDWPAAGDLDEGGGPNEAGRAAVNKFGGYLHDLDDDDTPEIAVPGLDGVHIYRREDSFFEPAGVLDIYPPLRLEPKMGVALWPENDRVIQPPYLRRSCSYRFEGGQVTVGSRNALSQSRIQFRVAHFPLVAEADDTFRVAPPTEVSSEPVIGRHTVAIRLNEDDIIDLCRFDWRRIYRSSLPMPISEVAVSTDAGKSFVTIQMLANDGATQVIDLNGDRRMDLIVQGMEVFDGGLRETVLQVTSRRRVDMRVHFYLQNVGNTFTRDPNIVHTFGVELDKPPIHWTGMVRRMIDGELLNLEGDFDGDGFRDAAVHDRPDRIAVYLGSLTGFQSKPYGEIPASPNSDFYAADFDSDGRSDIVVSHQGEDNRAVPLRDVLYLLRDSAP